MLKYNKDNNPKIKDIFRHAASTAINSSHAMIVTLSSKLRTFVYDFDSETWSEYPMVENQFYTMILRLLMSFHWQLLSLRKIKSN